MRIKDLDISRAYPARVISSELLTQPGQADEVRHLVLEVQDSSFRFQAGQSIAVVVPGPHDFGNQEHIRLYSIASGEEGEGGNPARIAIAVRRCFYIDEFSGEKHRGIASNYLCDRKAGEEIRIAGPFNTAFEIPEDPSADLLLIGIGTGIAPFRAFVKRIYRSRGGWKGQVRLFYGARSGLEAVYLNDRKNDFANYYDEETFKAFQAVSLKPHMDSPIELEAVLARNAGEIWGMILKPNTHVYVSGQEKLREMLEAAFVKMAGSQEKWARRKAELEAGKRWAELLY